VLRCIEGLVRLYHGSARDEEAASFATELVELTPADDPGRAAREELRASVLAALDEGG
jgi:hypothetical protein